MTQITHLFNKHFESSKTVLKNANVMTVADGPQPQGALIKEEEQHSGGITVLVSVLVL